MNNIQLKDYYILAACVAFSFLIAGCELPPDANTAQIIRAANQPPVEDPFDPDRFEGELVVFADGRAIVKGVADAARARSVYARLIGN